MKTQDITSEFLKSYHPERFPVIEMLFNSIERRGLDIDLVPREKGVEFRFLNEIQGIPNRGYLRIYFPESKCVLFFHKKSSVPFSHDRFSYGGVVIDERSSQRFQSEEIDHWIDYLFNGLAPGFRPASLKKSLPLTIPED